MAHRLGVATLGVQPPPGRGLLGRSGKWPAECAQAVGRPSRLERQPRAGTHVRRSRGVQQREHLEDVAPEREIPFHEGPGESELSWSPEQATHRIG